jgi:KDO2-lipid IV(A) lauroyltransferase
VHPPLQDFPTGDDLADAEMVNRQVEKMILEQPDQYMWIHRRFKTRPPGESRPYPKSSNK